MKVDNYCEECDGEGTVVYSCCGDNITFDCSDNDLCPSCGEHCGDEPEECEECKGEG